MTDVDWLVVGLGNPGPTYAGTRHNIGYLVVDELARRMGGALRAHKSGRADVRRGPARPLRASPLPGGAGAAALLHERDRGSRSRRWRPSTRCPTERIVAIHDELDIAFGTLRIKLGGGDNGHNGLRSMRSSLGTGEFYRVRAGVGRPPGRQDPADFVLSNYSAAERKELPVPGGPGRRRRGVPGRARAGADPAALQLQEPIEASQTEAETSPRRRRRIAHRLVG